MHCRMLFDEITTNSLVLTPNRRLSSFLREKYDQWQQRKALHSWPSIAILPFDNWLHLLWDKCLEFQQGYCLLSSIQEQYLWEQIIKQATAGHELLQLKATAKHAVDAWHLLNHWQLPIKQTIFDKYVDCATFYDWLRLYQQYCQIHKFIDSHVLPKHVIKILNKESLTLPDKIRLVGFEECSPLQQALLESLARQGCAHEFIHLSVETPRVNQIGLENTEAELLLMARWAKAQYLQQPQQNLACVIPNLSEIRPQVEKVFTKVFDETSYLQLIIDRQQPFNISGGQALLDFPLIFAAFTSLEMKEPHLPIEKISYFLRTPFIKGYVEEYANRAKLDSKIRALGRFTLSQSHFLALLKQHCPQLGAQYGYFCGVKTPKQSTASEWSELFSLQLQRLAWPGDRELTSLEYQLFSRLKELFTEFASVDTVSENLSFTEALSYLRYLASVTVFQAQSKNKPIQVLGTLEAAGIPFDQCWVMGMDDRRWPAAPKPNPFIPKYLQLKHQLPNASAERELTFSRQLLKGFNQCAHQVIYSYPTQADDRELLPSPLLKSIAHINSQDLLLADYEDIALRIHQSRDLEPFIDIHTTPIHPEELIQLRGGTAIFKHVSACPFRAFAIFRLNAIGFDKPVLGLSPLERGSLIHVALERLWQILKNQHDLIKLTETELIATINEAIDRAITTFVQNKKQQQSQFFAIERKRLQNILLSWLELEKQRPPFSIVSTEAAFTTEFSGLPLNFRIDRIDQLESGEKILMDYKTGLTSINQWFGERPEEPQMPLYCLTTNYDIKAILFAQLKTQRFAFKGVSAKSIHIKGVKSIAELHHEESAAEWSQQLKSWEIILRQKAQQFLQGDAAADPKDGSKTCDYCELQSFCRIHERMSETNPHENTH